MSLYAQSVPTTVLAPAAAKVGPIPTGVNKSSVSLPVRLDSQAESMMSWAEVWMAVVKLAVGD